MLASVKLITQRMGKRQFMVELHKKPFSTWFDPAKVADRIEGWGTLYGVERVRIGQGKEFARLYVTTTDLNLDARMLKRSVDAECEMLENEAKQNEK